MQPKYTWSRNDVGSTKSTSFMRIFKPVLYFLSCLRVSFRPHTQTIMVLVIGLQINIPNSELFPKRTSIELSQIATVLPEGDRTDSFRGERLDLPYRTMILAICVVVDGSKCLDVPIWEFSIILGASSIFTWV